MSEFVKDTNNDKNDNGTKNSTYNLARFENSFLNPEPKWIKDFSSSFENRVTDLQYESDELDSNNNDNNTNRKPYTENNSNFILKLERMLNDKKQNFNFNDNKSDQVISNRYESFSDPTDAISVNIDEESYDGENQSADSLENYQMPQSKSLPGSFMIENFIDSADESTINNVSHNFEEYDIYNYTILPEKKQNSVSTYSSVELEDSLRFDTFGLCLPTKISTPSITLESLENVSHESQHTFCKRLLDHANIVDSISNDITNSSQQHSQSISPEVIHGEIEEAIKYKIPKLCNWDNCTLSFENIKDHYTHIEKHHIPRRKPNYTCQWTKCERKFTQRQKLLRHLTSHINYKQFHCRICDKSFKHIEQLKNHNRLHSGIIMNECQFCGKTFSSPSALQVHKRMHTGEKPHKCEICSKRFSDPSNYSKHLKIHSK